MSKAKLLIVALCGTAVTFVMAQVPRVSIESPATRWRAATGENRLAQLRVDTSLVLVPVLVTDRTDRTVTGLTKSNFRLYDDNVEQQISQFFVEDAPVSVVLAFDTSSSMGPKLQMSRMAVAELLKVSNPEDEFALVEFGDRARLALPFTDVPEELQNKLMFLDSRGCTALVDAAVLALDEMKRSRSARKAIVIVSDGGDNHSRYKVRDLKRRLREVDVQVYSIAIVEPVTRRGATPEELEGPNLLNDLATQTGGAFFEVASLGDMGDIGSRIGAALRNQYVLGYSPSTTPRDGRYHKISVKLEPAGGQAHLRATFRTSYLARTD